MDLADGHDRNAHEHVGVYLEREGACGNATRLPALRREHRRGTHTTRGAAPRAAPAASRAPCTVAPMSVATTNACQAWCRLSR